MNVILKKKKKKNTHTHTKLNKKINIIYTIKT